MLAKLFPGIFVPRNENENNTDVFDVVKPVGLIVNTCLCASSLKFFYK